MTKTHAPAEALNLLLDRYTDAYHAFGEAMDAREWPDDPPQPIMTDWQRARRDQFNAARIALEKALPDLVRERAALLARAEAAEAEVKRLREKEDGSLATLIQKMGWDRMSIADLELLQRHESLPSLRDLRGAYLQLRTAALAGSPS